MDDADRKRKAEESAEFAFALASEPRAA